MGTSIEDVADAMYEMVKEYKGRKQFTARELSKVMQEKFDDCDRKMCKDALKALMDSKRCVYTYKGGSYVELPE